MLNLVEEMEELLEISEVSLLLDTDIMGMAIIQPGVNHESNTTMTITGMIKMLLLEKSFTLQII